MNVVGAGPPEGFEPLAERLLAQLVRAHEREVEALRSRLEALGLRENALEELCGALQPGPDHETFQNVGPPAAQGALLPEDSSGARAAPHAAGDDVPRPPRVHVVDPPKPVCMDLCSPDEPFGCGFPGTAAGERPAQGVGTPLKWQRVDVVDPPKPICRDPRSPDEPLGCSLPGAVACEGPASAQVPSRSEQGLQQSAEHAGAGEAGAATAPQGPRGQSDERLSANKALLQARKMSMDSQISPGLFGEEMGPAVKWQWMHRKGWRDYKEKEARQLEEAFQNGDFKARLKSGKRGHHPMEIFFADMLQHDCESRRVRAVQRLGPDPWWPRLRRFCRSLYRSWETGRPRMESFEEFYYSDIHQGQVKDDQGNIFEPSQKGCDEEGSEMERKNRLASACKGVVDSAVFQRCAMCMILTNAIWIAIETDINDAQNLLEADAIFVVVENLFCVAFTLEMTVRFLSYARKRDAFFDAMFMFDSLCTVSMIIEIWLVPLLWLLVSGQQGTTNTSLGIFRLARLLRMTRISRLVSVIPDFVTLLKGLSRSFKPVMVSTILLSVLVMLFAIVIRGQVKGTWLGQCCWAEEHCEVCDGYFHSIPETILTLFYNGTLLDSVKKVVDTIRVESFFLTLIFTIYIFATNCAMLNMLIGILCGVVAEAKEKEKEMTDKYKLMSRLSDIMEIYDKDGDHRLAKSEFDMFVTNPEVKHVLTEFHVDVWNLQTFMDEYAASLSEDALEEELNKGDTALTFDEILDIVLRLRGGGGASVSDIVGLRRFTGQRLDNVESKVNALYQAEPQHLERIIQGVMSHYPAACKRP